MLIPLLLMAIAYKTFYIYTLLINIRSEIIESEYNATWVKKMIGDWIMLFENFFSMGGYGIYVWSAYAITFIVLILNLFFTIKKEKKILRNYKKNK